MGNTVPAVGFAVGVICSGFLNGSRVEPQDQSDYENKYKFYTPKSVSRIYIYLWYFTIITSETFVCDQEFRVHMMILLRLILSDIHTIGVNYFYYITVIKRKAGIIYYTH